MGIKINVLVDTFKRWGRAVSTLGGEDADVLNKFDIAPLMDKLGAINSAEEQLAEQRAQLDAKAADLALRRSVVEQSLSQYVFFGQIEPGEENSDFHRQLFENEKVHFAKDVDDMVNMRIGDKGSCKRAFARWAVNNGVPEITAGIFTFMTNVAVSGGAPSYRDLLGDIDGVLEHPVEAYTPPRAGEVAVAVLYTISKGVNYRWAEGGRKLVENIYAHFQKEMVERGHPIYLTTLSPIRGFTLAMEAELGRDKVDELLANDEGQDYFRQRMMQYFCELDEKDRPDEVMNFHLGNGASICDIKFNPSSKKDWAMVNYLYHPDPERLAMCKALYLQKQIRSMAPHLYELMEREELRGHIEKTKPVDLYGDRINAPSNMRAALELLPNTAP